MYRHIKATKKVGVKTRKYTNLAVFNRECSVRGRLGSYCVVQNLRCLKDGGGLVSVKTTPIGSSGKWGKSGTWLLHFNSCEVMKRHLRNRVLYDQKALRKAKEHGFMVPKIVRTR